METEWNKKDEGVGGEKGKKKGGDNMHQEFKANG